jgi:hypothetical protein
MTGEPTSERTQRVLPDTRLSLPLRLPIAGAGSRRAGRRPAARAAAVACLALWSICLAGVPAPAVGAARGSAGDGQATAPAADDPVVGEVLQMLRGGVAEPVIKAWLDRSGRRPAAVSSGDLVALHQAGGSDQLLKWLLEPVGGPSPAPAAAAPPAGAAPPSATAAPPSATAASPATAAPPATATPSAAVAPPAASPAPSGTLPVKVRFAVTYRPTFADPEQPPSERWLLCVYVDGRFVASVKAGPVLLPLPPRTFERELAPGKHLLRLTQERHLPYSRARGYVSPARVDPSELPFELQPAAATQIAIRFGERSRKHPGPVAVRIERDGREVARLEPAAADPEAWPTLCEDIPAALPASAKLPAEARRELESCVHWQALWPGVEAVPAREEVRAEVVREAHPPGGATH